MHLATQGRARIVIPVTRQDAMKFSEAASACLLFLASPLRGYSQRTIDNYGTTCEQFMSYLIHVGALNDVASFTVDNVKGFAEWLGQHGASSNTIINKLCGLQAVARWLMTQTDKRGRPRLTMDPTKGFEPPRRVKPKTEYLRPAHLVAVYQMLAKLERHHQVLWEVLLDTGIRASEAIDANVGDVQEVDGGVAILVPVKGRKQEGAEPGVYPLSAPVADALRASLRERDVEDEPNAPLLVNHEGERWKRTAMGECIAWIGRKAGITGFRLSPHKLRHTANVIATAGIDTPTRAALLDHRNQQTVQRYDHIVAGALHEARAKQRAALDAYVSQGEGHAEDRTTRTVSVMQRAQYPPGYILTEEIRRAPDADRVARLDEALRAFRRQILSLLGVDEDDLNENGQASGPILQE